MPGTGIGMSGIRALISLLLIQSLEERISDGLASGWLPLVKVLSPLPLLGIDNKRRTEDLIR